jgi:Skp family chaperone for outer membrane proteins
MLRDYFVAGGAVVALALLAYAGFQRGAAAKAKAEVKALQGEVESLQESVESATRASDGWRATHAAADRALRECVAEWDRAVQAGSAAQQQALAAARQLEAERAEWQRRWKERSAGCTQSLYAMQAACAAEVGAF